MKLVAKRSMTYAGRRLKAGDEFETRSNQDARALIAVRRAEAAPVRPAPQPSPQVVEPERDEMAELRAEYERVVGKRPWHGWDAATLRDKMAEARSAGTYARRDLRVED